MHKSLASKKFAIRTTFAGQESKQLSRGPPWSFERNKKFLWSENTMLLQTLLKFHFENIISILRQIAAPKHQISHVVGLLL